MQANSRVVQAAVTESFLRCKQDAEMGEAGRQGGGGGGWRVFLDPWTRIDTGSMQRHHGLSVGGGLPYQRLLLTCAGWRQDLCWEEVLWLDG